MVRLQTTLRKMKKLRTELKNVCGSEVDPGLSAAGGGVAGSSSGEGSATFYSLGDQQRLLQALGGGAASGDDRAANRGGTGLGTGSSYNHIHHCGYSSGGNSAIGSNSNLQHLQANSGYGSEGGSEYDYCGASSFGYQLGGDSSGGNSHRSLDRLDCATPTSGGRPSLPCRRRPSTPPSSSAAVSASIPIVPSGHIVLTPSQSAAVATSGVAAFSFMTTATTGSDDGMALEADGAQRAVVGGHPPHQSVEERLSLGSGGSSVFGEDNPLDVQEAAMECVDGLKVRLPWDGFITFPFADHLSLCFMLVCRR